MGFMSGFVFFIAVISVSAMGILARDTTSRDRTGKALFAGCRKRSTQISMKSSIPGITRSDQQIKKRKPYHARASQEERNVKENRYNAPDEGKNHAGLQPP
jgi:hypothetical protein